MTRTPATFGLLFVALRVCVANAEPYWPGGDAAWEQVDAETAGADSNQLETALAYAGDHASKGVVVLWGGRILAERYWDGWTVATTGAIYSASKGMTAVLVGMAIEEGFITNADEKCSDFLWEWQFSSDTNKRDVISVRHLLSMNSGLEGGVTNLVLGLLAKNERAFGLLLPVVHAPGTYWDYNNPAYRLLFYLLEAATGEGFPAYVQRKLFDPLGMTNAYWAVRLAESEGQTITNYQWAAVTTREAARFGLFMLRGGQWNGVPLVSNEWVQLCLTNSQAHNPAYGLLWWLNGSASHYIPFDYESRGGWLWPDVPPDAYGALGNDDNKIYVVPSLDLVVSRLGDEAYETAYAVSQFDNFFLGRICRAFGYTGAVQEITLGISGSMSAVEVAVPTWNGRLYTLETASNSMNGAWSCATGMTDWVGVGHPLVYTQDAPTARAEFYRAWTRSPFD